MTEDRKKMLYQKLGDSVKEPIGDKHPLLFEKSEVLPHLDAISDKLDEFIQQEEKRNPAIKEEVFWKAIMDYIYHSSSKYNFFDKIDHVKRGVRKPEREGNNPKQDDPIRNMALLAKLLCHAFDIDPKFFGLTPEQVFTKRSPKPTLKDVIVLKHDYTSTPDRARLRNIYRDSKKPFVDNAKTNIVAYEYLGKGFHDMPYTHLAGYQDAYEDIFRAVEVRLAGAKCGMVDCKGGSDCKGEKGKKCKSKIRSYTRVLTLQHSAEFNPTTNFMVKLQAAIQECSLCTFKHLCRCLIKFPSEKLLFQVEVAISPIHFVIIDDKFIMSEYYSYTSDGFLVPDLLFIEEYYRTQDQQDPVGKLLTNYKDKIRQLTQDKSLRLTKNNIRLQTEKAMNKMRILHEQKVISQEWYNEMVTKNNYLLSLYNQCEHRLNQTYVNWKKSHRFNDYASILSFRILTQNENKFDFE